MILVDPSLDSCVTCAGSRRDPGAEPYRRCKPSCLMLEDPTSYDTRKALWNARSWNQKDTVRGRRHRSSPYHGGITTLIRPHLCFEEEEQRTSAIESQTRNQASIFDELIFYWTQCPEPQAIEACKRGAVNSAYYLLKYVAAAWDNQLEFIAYSVANSQWFKDDHEAGMVVKRAIHDWNAELSKISTASKDINHMRRKVSQYQQAVALNMERIGMQLGEEKVNYDLPLALRHAQKDFLAVHSRLIPLRTQIDGLSTIASEVASLRTTFKGIEDGANSLRLSLFLAIFFPLTLVSSMLSMGDDFLPGKRKFWVYWASSLPLATVLAAGMIYAHTRQAWNPSRRLGKSFRPKYSHADSEHV